MHAQAYGLLIDTKSGNLEWPWVDGVMVVIFRYFYDFRSLIGTSQTC